MRWMKVWTYILSCVLLPCSPMEAANVRKMHITWFMHQDHDFWLLNQKVAEDAAKDFGIPVDFILTPDTVGNHRLTSYKLAVEYLDALKKEPDTDYFLAMIGGIMKVEEVLYKAKEKGVAVFFFNNQPEERYTPRAGSFAALLGGMIPDDRNAGYLEAQHLIRKAKSRDPQKPVHVVALGGWSRDVVDTERRAGLEKAIQEEGAQLDQYLFSRWSPDVAKEVIARSRKIHPEALVFWTIADYLGLAALDVLKTEKIPFLIGGVDWSKEALASLQSSSGLSVSVGGHFLDPGWTTAVLYDYHKGLDFKGLYPSLIIPSHMSALDGDSVRVLSEKFPNYDWSRIDFKQFSRFESQAKAYDFSLAGLLKK